MASRREVAEAANVSMRTVSNVVNGHPHVAEETRARVNLAIDRLGYRPSELARNLKAGRSGLIALVLPELDNPYFAELTRAFVEEGRRRGLTIVIDQTDGDRVRELELIDRTDAGSLFDALIISPLGLRAEDIAAIDPGRPLVFLGERVFPSFDHVMIDNEAAARDAVAHLVAAGRHRIAAIGAQDDEQTSSLRLAGYRRGLEEAGLEVDESLIEHTPTFRRADGASAMERLLALPEPPDAVFCFADPLALGAYRTLAIHGVRVPSEIALVGVDDVEDGRFASPPLTTISPDKAFVATAVLDRIAAKLDGGGAEPASLTMAPYRLEVRGSSVDPAG